MVIQRLEMCISLLKMAVEFVLVFAEAVGLVINHNATALLANSASVGNDVSVPFIGFLL